MVVSGLGVCDYYDGKTKCHKKLYPGMIFCIHANGMHKFATTHSNLTVVAYHPESDYGPVDKEHPMINRTMIAGQSAKEIEKIHTK